jgi:hypothetical protein
LEVIVDAAATDGALRFEKVAAFNPAGIAPVIEDGLLVFVDTTGSVVTTTGIACRSAEWIEGSDLVIFGVNNGVEHSSSLNDDHGIANIEGDVVVPVTHGLEVYRAMAEGLIDIHINLERGGSFGYSDESVAWLDDDGDIVIPWGLYNDGGSFHDGLAWVDVNSAPSNGQVDYDIDGGYIDTTGALVIPRASLGLSGENHYDFAGGVAVLDYGYRGVIDTAGNFVIPADEYDRIENNGDGTLLVATSNDRRAIIGSDGAVIVPAEFQDLEPGSEGLYPFADASGLWGYLGADGQVAIEPGYLAASDFSGGRAFVSQGHGYDTIIDSQGGLVAAILDPDEAYQRDTGGVSVPGNYQRVRALKGGLFEAGIDTDNYGGPDLFTLLNRDGISVIFYEWNFEGDESMPVLSAVPFEDEFYDGVPGVIITAAETEYDLSPSEAAEVSRIYNYAGDGIYGFEGVPRLDDSYQRAGSSYLWTRGSAGFGIVHIIY